MQEETAQDKTSESPEEEQEEQEETTDSIIRKHVYIAMGISLIPVPFVDFIGVTGAQLNLLRNLAKAYNVPFSKDMVKTLIAALLGGAAPASIGAQLGGSLAKTVPVIGLPLGIAGTSAVGGAATYAVGKVFNRHFAEGGTFLTFDPEEARAFYAEMFKEGGKVAADLKAGKQK